MPELPEVETTLRGIAPHTRGRRIIDVRVRERRLRWPIEKRLPALLRGAEVQDLQRRAKYMLFATDAGYFMLHLGMSGSLRVLPVGTAPGKHDHVDIVLDSDQLLRFNDPRRFGSLHWLGDTPLQHDLLRHLGPEPLAKDFDGDYLFARSRKKKQATKQFIMDGKIVVGVGNIYASEALFMAGIRPGRAAGRVSADAYNKLAIAIKQVLQDSIEMGGTTLRDFVGGDGKPGYFRQTLRVYGRAGQPCVNCNSEIRQKRLSQRSTFYCSNCQS